MGVIYLIANMRSHVALLKLLPCRQKSMKWLDSYLVIKYKNPVSIMPNMKMGKITRMQLIWKEPYVLNEL